MNESLDIAQGKEVEQPSPVPAEENAQQDLPPAAETGLPVSDTAAETELPVSATAAGTGLPVSAPAAGTRPPVSAPAAGTEPQASPPAAGTESPVSTSAAGTAPPSATPAEKPGQPGKSPAKQGLISRLIFKLPLGVLVAVCVLPAVLIALFYILLPNTDAMGWVSIYVSAPVRGFMGMLTSVYPFSVTEVLLTAAIIWLVFYLVKTVMVTVRRRKKLRILSKRFLLVAVLALYVWSAFCWLWSSGYHAPGFAERNGFARSGVSIEDLKEVTKHFADRANELAPLVARDSSGSFDESRSELFATSTGIFENIAAEFSCLNGSLYRAKPMMFSWLMSRTGYSGMYFALTGEANINNMTPGAFLPVTLAHEHVHQLGVFAEDEANFVGILASIKSDNAVFAYSGYLLGLNHLLNALSSSDVNAWHEIAESLTYEVWRDRRDSSDFWLSQRTVDTDIWFIDTTLTSLTGAVRETVDAAYDSFLKSQNQELGLQSYGACVDLLVEYFS